MERVPQTQQFMSRTAVQLTAPSVHVGRNIQDVHHQQVFHGPLGVLQLGQDVEIGVDERVTKPTILAQRHDVCRMEDMACVIL